MIPQSFLRTISWTQLKFEQFLKVFQFSHKPHFQRNPYFRWPTKMRSHQLDYEVTIPKLAIICSMKLLFAKFSGPHLKFPLKKRRQLFRLVSRCASIGEHCRGEESRAEESRVSVAFLNRMTDKAIYPTSQYLRTHLALSFSLAASITKAEDFVPKQRVVTVPSFLRFFVSSFHDSYSTRIV